LQPEILFLSEPELPEDEVLARLLFGRGIETLSPLQAAQLAGAVANLAGVGGEGIVSRLRKGFGLDDLDVTGDAEGGVGVRAGKYISDNIYTDVEIDSLGQAEVSINLDLSPSVTVKGSVDNEGQSGIGVFFERDY
jgi:translocation and assembly module TamB